ncbi:MAG: hypothetical protein KatS3mg105_2164 [Gemmatales bacterium]|nr:MAG: hypothetical protein KatS3mg105_2164 [Gemmatales bacterium]
MRLDLAAGLAAVVLMVATSSLSAEELEPKYRKVVERGLNWLAKSQYTDGHWDANGGNYPVAMTALAGMALLMEGSTCRQGKYANNIRKAVTWLTQRSQANGMIGNPRNQIEAGRYMYGHGFSVLFLSQVYGEEEDETQRQKLEKILTRAVEFTGKAQTARGGWGYVSARDGNGFDEGSVTITQVQALRAARNAGIVVPKEIIDKAKEYLRRCTTPNGGVIYSLASGGAARAGAERLPLTAAAVACMFNAGEYDSDLAKRWLAFCQQRISLVGNARMGHDEYTHYYLAQALYILGDKGYEKLFPNTEPSKRLVWSRYRQAMFERLASAQNNNGSFQGRGIGDVYTTSLYLTILQLDLGTLPIYQR